MIIGGVQKTSLVDWPAKICSTVFIAGCNLRCGFCYNKELVLPQEIEQLEPISENELLAMLVARKKYIDGVCITGGEPLMSPDVVKLIRKIKAKGLGVKLDTNGTVPTLLKGLIDEGLLDFVAMDIKAPIDRYQEVTGSNVNPELVEKSINILKESGIDYEFRTTVVKGIHSISDIIGIGEWLDKADAYYIQQFMGKEDMIDPDLKGRKAYTPDELKEMMEAVQDRFRKTGVRNV